MVEGHRVEVAFTREDCVFESGDCRCAAWLYRPAGITRPPVVVMAHGFGAERDFGLVPFAERFVGRGMAVFVFDYRCFGRSEGEPRYLINPWRQVRDWRAALSHVRSLPGINADKLAIWGSSYGAGHTIMVASRDPNIKALVAQVPFVDGITSTLRTGLWHALQGSAAAAKDILTIIPLKAPHYIPITSNPDKFAVLKTPESGPGYMSILPQGTSWENRTPARSVLQLLFYRPVTRASKVMCPALVIAGNRDSLIDPQAVERTASKMREATLLHFNCGHFDVYSAPLL